MSFTGQLGTPDSSLGNILLGVAAAGGSGVGTAAGQAQGAGVAGFIGNAAGQSQESGVGASLFAGVGSSSGAATASGVGASLFAGQGVSAGAAQGAGVEGFIGAASGHTAILGFSVLVGPGQGIGQASGSAQANAFQGFIGQATGQVMVNGGGDRLTQVPCPYLPGEAQTAAPYRGSPAQSILDSRPRSLDGSASYPGRTDPIASRPGTASLPAAYRPGAAQAGVYRSQAADRGGVTLPRPPVQTPSYPGRLDQSGSRPGAGGTSPAYAPRSVELDSSDGRRGREDCCGHPAPVPSGTAPSLDFSIADNSGYLYWLYAEGWL